METGDENVISKESSSQEDVNTRFENQYVYNQVQLGSHQSYVVNISSSNQQLIQQLIQQSGESTRPPFEKVLLAVVREEIVSRLKSLPYNEVLINLSKQTQYISPWSDENQTSSVLDVQILPEVKIIDVFERADIAGRLLILGEPGSGKTATLLDLAQDLIQRAEVDPNHAIPVLFNLSAWNTSYPTIQDWLISELKSKYGVRTDISKEWIKNQKLLPLLDGLDEVKIDYQTACIHSINQWIKSEPSISIVVCSRRADYEIQKLKLKLRGAIWQKDLTDQQIQSYLIMLNELDLWQILQTSPILLELMRKPLLLNIAILVCQELEIGNRKNLASASDFLEFLLDSYVHRMLSRPLGTYLYTQKTPSARQARKWLLWLAQQMEYRALTEFSIEKIDPSWLKSLSQKFYYRFILGIIIGIFGIFISGLIFGSWIGVIFGFFGSYVIDFALGTSSSITRLQNGRPQKLPNSAIYKLAKSAIIKGVLSGLSISLVLWALTSLVKGFSIGMGIGLLIALIFGGLACLQHFALRFVLWKSGNIPWNYAHFLNYCSERCILQRVGGSYRFIHRLMQDHFAAMPY